MARVLLQIVPGFSPRPDELVRLGGRHLKNVDQHDRPRHNAPISTDVHRFATKLTDYAFLTRDAVRAGLNRRRLCSLAESLPGGALYAEQIGALIRHLRAACPRVVPNCAVVPGAVVEGWPARWVSTLFESLPCPGVLTQQNLTPDRTGKPAQSVAGRHRADVAAVVKRELDGPDNVALPHHVPGEQAVEGIA